MIWVEVQMRDLSKGAEGAKLIKISRNSQAEEI